MLEAFDKNKGFEYQRLTPEEMTSRGILGRLTGPIADTINGTRNGRAYKEKLWQKVFDDPIVQEKINTRCLFGELGHPIDERTSTDVEKIAICLAEIPKKGPDGLLYGVFDILDTPNGRILKAMADYGCNIGVSSRGEGDVITNFDGDEEVDPDTYYFECFDAVLLPAVKKARMKYVTESLESKKSLKQVLNEELNNASDSDRKIMQSTINNLNLEDLDLSDDDAEILREEEPEDDEEITLENNVNVQDSEPVDIDDVSEKVPVDNDKGMIEQYQNLLKQMRTLEEQIISLNEKLSVSYAKEASYKNEITQYKESISSLTKVSKQVNALKIQNESLQRRLDNEAKLKEDVKNLTLKLDKSSKENNQLSIKLKECLSKTKTLTEEMSKTKDDSKSIVEDLNIKLADKDKDLIQLKSNYAKKLQECNKTIEKYKSIANKAVNRYIESKATSLGISINEIKNKLPESYTFNDIDNVCEDLRDYKINISKLPFQVNGKQLTESANIKIKSQVKSPLEVNPLIDDDVDDQLLSLAR